MIQPRQRMTDFLSFQKPMEQSILVSSYHTLHWGSQLCLGTEIPSGLWAFSQMKCYWNQEVLRTLLRSPTVGGWFWPGPQVSKLLSCCFFCFTRLASFLLKNYLLTMELLVKYKAYILLTSHSRLLRVKEMMDLNLDLVSGPPLSVLLLLLTCFSRVRLCATP